MERAPDAVLKAAISNVVSALPSKQADGPVPFLAAGNFQGRKQGYFFSVGAHGLGCVQVYCLLKACTLSVQNG